MQKQNSGFFLPALAIIVILLAFVAVSIFRNTQNPIQLASDPEETTSGKSLISKFNLTEERETPVPFKKPGVRAELASSTWVPQTFNNCAPAATSMVLQHFGYTVSQAETKSKLRTTPDDKNVFIYEVSEYLKRDYGIESKIVFNGDIETLKTLTANGIYVVVEDWLKPNDDIGHVLVVRGFDDTEQVLIADDSYFGTGIKYPYKSWDETQWKPYNREFMPVYDREKEGLVKAIIGENWSEKTMHQNSVEKNREDVNKNPNDMYAHFNLGTSYYYLGEYQKAREAFEKSHVLGWTPRMMWYFVEPVKTQNALGEYQKAIEWANIGLRGNDDYAEAHYEKAYAYKKLNNPQMSKSEAAKTLELDPGFNDTYNLF